MRRTRLRCLAYLTALVIMAGASVAGCTANLLNTPIPLARTSLPGTAEQAALVSKLDYEPANGKTATFIGLRGLRAAVRNALLNSRQFARVRVGRNFDDVPASSITYFDITLKAQEEGQFDWAWTWPAVYPMSLYWPIQSKAGKVKLQMQATAYRGSRKVYAATFECEKNYDITFYGFFRTSPIETKAMLCYRDLLTRFSESVASPDFGKGVVEVPRTDNVKDKK